MFVKPDSNAQHPYPLATILKAADRGLSKIASVMNSASSTVFRHPQSTYAADRTTSSVPDSAYLNGSHSYWSPSPYPAEERVPIPVTGGLYSNGPQGYPSHDGFDPDEDEYEDYPPQVGRDCPGVSATLRLGCSEVERYEQDKTWVTLGMAIRFHGDVLFCCRRC